jgi:hypothetical protein
MTTQYRCKCLCGWTGYRTAVRMSCDCPKCGEWNSVQRTDRPRHPIRPWLDLQGNEIPYTTKPPCPHPPTRLYAWHAHDGTLCVGCNDCGAVLAGAAETSPA